MKNIIKKQEKEVLGILDIIKKRKFKGYTGLVIKNSLYQLAATFSAKIGSLLFTIILARMLMPELFGLYSLALSTIVIFVSFADLGIGPTLIRFVSRELGKNKKAKAKAYVSYLLKWKIILILIFLVVLVASAGFIANNYYQKPLFLALIAGSLYILSISLIGFIESIFHSTNNFKYPLIYFLL